MNVDNTSKAGIFSGVITSMFGWLTLTDFLAIVGCMVAVGSLYVNYWYKKEMLKIEHEKLKNN